jgi:hypothetical protein
MLESATYRPQPRAALAATRKTVLETVGCFPLVCGEIVHLLDPAHFDDFVISLLAN